MGLMELVERRDQQLRDCARRIKRQRAEIKRLARHAADMESWLDAAEALDRGEDVNLPQPHPSILSIVVGNRRTMLELQEEVEDFRRLFDLQHRRTTEADKEYVKAHPRPEYPHGYRPDLGKLVGWLLEERRIRGEQVRELRCEKDNLLVALCGHEQRERMADTAWVDCRSQVAQARTQKQAEDLRTREAVQAPIQEFPPFSLWKWHPLPPPVRAFAEKQGRECEPAKQMAGAFCQCQDSQRRGTESLESFDELDRMLMRAESFAGDATLARAYRRDIPKLVAKIDAMQKGGEA